MERHNARLAYVMGWIIPLFCLTLMGWGLGYAATHGTLMQKESTKSNLSHIGEVAQLSTH